MANSGITRFGNEWFSQNDIDDSRDRGLELNKINRNSNISEMLDIIDSNFREIAKHGGGPAGLNGLAGINGMDGKDVEYIYTLSDEMVAGKHYPTDRTKKENLFNAVQSSESAVYPGNGHNQRWYNHALPIDEDHRNEYVMYRYKQGESSDWIYADPILWAHWGESGKDGDGVEYIFMTSTEKLTQQELDNSIKKTASMSATQKVIYNLDGFVPGTEWFGNEQNKGRANEAFGSSVPSDLNQNWYSGYGMLVSGRNWTDEPSGTSLNKPYEYVSIRKSQTNESTGKKEWGDFSSPSLWSNFGLSSRTFLIYYNADPGVTPASPVKGQGWWDVASDTLVLDPPANTGAGKIPQGWTNVNHEDPKKITWVCNGIFDNSGKNTYWSEPMRITGEDGENGKDGSLIQFIYTLSKNKPHYPGDGHEHGHNPNNIKNGQELFDWVETNGTCEYGTANTPSNCTTWHDNALEISKNDPTEYVWSRTRASEATDWVLSPEPVIWAHWGEDGTDGDGVEYIFITTQTNDNSTLIPVIRWSSTDTILKNEQKVIFQIDDFVPSPDWFNDTNKEKVKNAFRKQNPAIVFDETKWASTYYGFKDHPKWTDNPVPVDAHAPFQWVSIRKSHNDTNGNRVWDDFSEPVLWNSYGKETRTFIVYCNIPGDPNGNERTPNRIEDGKGWWWHNGNDDSLLLYESDFAAIPNDDSNPWKNLETGDINYSQYVANYAFGDPEDTEHNPLPTPTQIEQNIGIWSNHNTDVEGTIAWMSTGSFSEDGKNISWSDPFRITGYKGKPGTDGTDIEFVYTLSDRAPQPDIDYPNPATAQASTLKSFFDNIEGTKKVNWDDKSDPVNAGYDIANMDEDEDHVIFYTYNNTPGGESTSTLRWYDNPKGVKDIEGRRTEWVWSRSKSAVQGDDQTWSYPPKPVIWSHWGEDGTDGDGIEYVFILADSPSFKNEYNNIRDWNNIWDNLLGEGNTDVNKKKVAKAIYSMDDFVPDNDWFDKKDTTDPTKYVNKENVKKAITDNDDEIPSNFDELWEQIKTAWGSPSSAIGKWTDNPGDVDAAYPYQYVSIRKSKEGNYEYFQYPKLWSKYGKTTFTVFVFTATEIDADISLYEPRGIVGNNLNDPKPKFIYLVDTLKPDVSFNWTDGPEPETGKPIIWMTSLTVTERGENDNYDDLKWSNPKRMTDTSNFQIEWSGDDISGADLQHCITELNKPTYNFKNYLTPENGYDEEHNFDTSGAEAAWREVIHNDLGLRFSDSPNTAILMATCQVTNGTWSNWELVRVKGERGEAGHSVELKGKITYELYIDDPDPNNYNFNAAEAYMNANKPIGAKLGDLLIVYPYVDTEESDSDLIIPDILYGDRSLGGALYMWKYTGETWLKEPEAPSVAPPSGTTYISPENQHLIMWDGDSWQDIGKLVGPEGKSHKILIGYANDEPDEETGYLHKVITYDVANAKWIGVLTYVEGEFDPDIAKNNPNIVAEEGKHSAWQWSLFKGQDGYGFEYIFTATQTPDAPEVPNTTSDGYINPDYVPATGHWEDEPMEPTSDYKYVWMCWRKFDKTNGTWTDFMGKDNKTYEEHGVAKLWQIFNNPVTGVTEYYHADTRFEEPDASDADYPLFFTDDPSSPECADYWFTDKSLTDWGLEKPHLFNVEVTSYADKGESDIDPLYPHWIATWERGLVDFEEFYCLNNDINQAPHMENDRAETSSSDPEKQPGIDYWTKNGANLKIGEEYPYLWNIGRKTYEGGRDDKWTDPHIVGVYSYNLRADIDNEMDSIVVDKDHKVLVERTFETVVSFYKGLNTSKIKSCTVSSSGITTADSSNPITIYHKTGSGEWKDNSSNQVPENGVDNFKIKITLKQGDTIVNNYAKITITVENVDDSIQRVVTYTILGTTYKYTYSIVPSESAILYTNAGTRVPVTLKISVNVHKGEGNIETFTGGTKESNGFRLLVQKNSTEPVELTGEEYSVSTNNLSVGDKLTFTIYVDNDTNPNFETLLDKETVFVLREGKDGTPGAKGETGNGYQYCYMRYDNAHAPTATGGDNQYGGLTKVSVYQPYKTSNPSFTINGIPLTSTSEPKGADKTHQYEYRSERFGYGVSNAATWEFWSEPVIVAKYISDENIEQAITESATIQNINEAIGDANTRMNTFDGYFDDSGNLTANISDTIMNGIKTSTETYLNGVIASKTGVTTFADWVGTAESNIGKLTSVTQGMSAGENFGTLKDAITAANTSIGTATTAIQDMKVYADEKFASIDNIVANTGWLKDTDGYYLMKYPVFALWRKNNSTKHKYEDEKRNQLWMKMHLTPDGSTQRLTVATPVDVKDDISLCSVDGKYRYIFLKKVGSYTLANLTNVLNNSITSESINNNVKIKNVTKTSFEFELLNPDNSIFSENFGKLNLNVADADNKTTILCWAKVQIKDGYQTNLPWNVGVSKTNIPNTWNPSNISSNISSSTIKYYTYTGSVYDNIVLDLNTNNINDFGTTNSNKTDVIYYYTPDSITKKWSKYKESRPITISSTTYDNTFDNNPDDAPYTQYFTYFDFGNKMYALDKDSASYYNSSEYPDYYNIVSMFFNNKGNRVKEYTDINDRYKPYLIDSVSEIASISQTVSDGIAATSIIVGVGSHSASQIFQATQDESTIKLMADNFYIESRHINLNQNGLEINGDILLKDYDEDEDINYISSGMLSKGSTTLGANQISDQPVFFAGLTATDQALNNAPFRVTESGILYATSAIFKEPIIENYFVSSIINDFGKENVDASPAEFTFDAKDYRVFNVERIAPIYLDFLWDSNQNRFVPVSQIFEFKFKNLQRNVVYTVYFKFKHQVNQELQHNHINSVDYDPVYDKVGCVIFKITDLKRSISYIDRTSDWNSTSYSYIWENQDTMNMAAVIDANNGQSGSFQFVVTSYDEIRIISFHAEWIKFSGRYR